MQKKLCLKIFREQKWSKIDILGQIWPKSENFKYFSQNFENPTQSCFFSANLELVKFLVYLIWPLHHEDKSNKFKWFFVGALL